MSAGYLMSIALTGFSEALSLARRLGDLILFWIGIGNFVCVVCSVIGRRKGEGAHLRRS
jgi:hypothetical protein